MLTPAILSLGLALGEAPRPVPFPLHVAPLVAPLAPGLALARAHRMPLFPPAPPGPAVLYEESFDQPDGPAWPAPWFMAAPFILIEEDLDGGRARLHGWTAKVGRMILPGFAERDSDVTVTVEYEAIHSQGIGVYARQNGGYLDETDPVGAGYALFLQGGGSGPLELGLWREVNGVEELFAAASDPLADGGVNGARYVLRLQVEQTTPAATTVRAKVWNEGSPEPAGWTIEADDGTPSLQNVTGSFALDIYNYQGNGSVWFDDLVIRELP